VDGAPQTPATLCANTFLSLSGVVEVSDLSMPGGVQGTGFHSSSLSQVCVRADCGYMFLPRYLQCFSLLVYFVLALVWQYLAPWEYLALAMVW